ncbi:MAG: TetR/AcrR family transcriptional regulator [Candidatus Kapaibacterium sp.]
MDNNSTQISRRDREKLARRREIILAARTVFARKGFNDTKLEDVAELAEFGKGTLYNYFTNKEALFQVVLEDSFEALKLIAERTLNNDAPFPEKIDMFLREELTLFFNNLEAVQLFIRESHHLRGGNPLMHLMPQLLGIVADTIAAEQIRGTVMNDVQPMALAIILINMLMGQFNCRVLGRLADPHSCAHADNANDPHMSLSKIFADLTPQDIEREVADATKLIHAVFFNGIAR